MKTLQKFSPTDFIYLGKKVANWNHNIGRRQLDWDRVRDLKLPINADWQEGNTDFIDEESKGNLSSGRSPQPRWLNRFNETERWCPSEFCSISHAIFLK
jgi:hypothetical protein